MTRTLICALVLLPLAMRAQPICSNPNPRPLDFRDTWNINGTTCRNFQLMEFQGGHWNVVGVTATQPGWEIQMGSAASTAPSNLCDFVLTNARDFGPPSTLSGTVWRNQGSSPGNNWIRHGNTTTINSLPHNSGSLNWTNNSIVRLFEFPVNVPDNYTINVNVPGSNNGALRWRLFNPGTGPGWRHRYTNMVNETTNSGPIDVCLSQTGWYAIVVYQNGTPSAPGGNFPISYNVSIQRNSQAPMITSPAPPPIPVGSTSATISIDGANLFCGNTYRVGNTSVSPNPGATNSSITLPVPASETVTAGVRDVEVCNSVGQCATIQITIENPALNNLVRTSGPLRVCVNGEVDVSGDGFGTWTSASWGGQPAPVSVLSPTMIRVSIPANRITTPGNQNVILTNAAPAASPSSASVSVPVQNPAPIVSTMSQSVSFVNDPGFDLTLTGNLFLPGCFVEWIQPGNASVPLPTTRNGKTQLTAQISTNLLAAAGGYILQVVNPSPAAGPSNQVGYTVVYPVPQINCTNLGPITVGQPQVTLAVSGYNFYPASTVHWDQNPLLPSAVSYVSPTQLNVTLSAAQIGNAGSKALQVFNPPTSNGGGGSNVCMVTVQNQPPTLLSLSHASVVVGSPGFTLTVTGSGFVSGAQILRDGIGLTTNPVSSSELTTNISSSSLQTCGSFVITVTNPGTGPSNPLTFTVSCPVIAAVSPPDLGSVPASPQFLQLTLTGSGFLSAATSASGFPSQVWANGVPIPSFVNHAGNITIQVSSDIPGSNLPGGISLVVVNTPQGYSNAESIGIGAIPPWRNRGTTTLGPPALIPGGSARLAIEGGAPGQLFLAVGQPGMPTPVAPWPDASGNLVNGAFSIPGSFPIIDSVGVFGPGTGELLDANGDFFVPGIPLPSPFTGARFTIQTYYVSPLEPQGYGATWSSTPIL